MRRYENMNEEERAAFRAANREAAAEAVEPHGDIDDENIGAHDPEEMLRHVNVYEQRLGARWMHWDASGYKGEAVINLCDQVYQHAKRLRQALERLVKEEELLEKEIELGIVHNDLGPTDIQLELGMYEKVGNVYKPTEKFEKAKRLPRPRRGRH